MLAHTENIDGALLCIPVAPNAFEHAGAVVESMGHYVYVGFAYRYVPPSEEHLEIIPGRW